MITVETLNKIYRILVEEAGATDSAHEQWRFVTYVQRTLATWGSTEYCFQGLLEYGGKIHFTDYNKWFVTCYKENLTAQRQVIMMFTNQKLDALKEQINV